METVVQVLVVHFPVELFFVLDLLALLVRRDDHSQVERSDIVRIHGHSHQVCK